MSDVERLDNLGDVGRARERETNLEGFFTRHGENGKKQLALNLYLNDLCNCRCSYQTYRSISFIPLVRFEVRQYEKGCFIGEAIWAKYRSARGTGIPRLMSYNNLLSVLYNKYRTFKMTRQGHQLFKFRCVLANGFCAWPATLPVDYEMYVGGGVNRNECYVGSEFLKLGKVLYDQEYTYFFPNP